MLRDGCKLKRKIVTYKVIAVGIEGDKTGIMRSEQDRLIEEGYTVSHISLSRKNEDGENTFLFSAEKWEEI